jgi:hypothetical protein
MRQQKTRASREKVGTGFSQKRCDNKKREHRAKKWEPVSRKSDATTKNESKMPLQNERILL